MDSSWSSSCFCRLSSLNSMTITTHSWTEVVVKNSADCSTNGTPETSFSETCSDTPDVSMGTEENVQIPSSDANNAFPHKESGGSRNYELGHSCPKCLQKNSIRRESDRFGTYDSCRLCGWLDNISLSDFVPIPAPTLEEPGCEIPEC